MQSLLVRRLVMGLTLTLAVAAFGQSSAQSPSETSPKNFLLLYSYGHGGKGIRVLDNSLIDTLSADGIATNNLYFEFLDLERYKGNAQYRNLLHEELQRKYTEHHIDFILTIQQPALEFLLNEGKDIAPDAPAITLQAPLPNTTDAGNRHLASLVTKFDIKGTLERALELFPDTRRVVFVSGSSEADRKMAAGAASIAEAWRGKLEFEYTVDLSLEAMMKRVASLPPNSIVIFTQYNRDTTGVVTVAYEVEGQVVKAANAPVFGLYDFNLINGGIGGSVVSVKELGRKTAQLLLDLLHKRLVLSAPVTQIEMPVMPMFDWGQIQRWGGDPDRLGTDSVFVNRVPTFWEQYRNYVVSLTIFLLAQSLLIIALIVSRRRRRVAELLTEASKENLAITLKSIGDAVITTDIAGRVTSMNPAAERLCGWTLPEALGQPLPDVFRIVHSDTRESVADPVQMVMERRETVGLANHTVLVAKSGEEYQISDSAAPIRDAAGDVVGVVLVFSDVTAKYRTEKHLQRSRTMMERTESMAHLASFEWEVDSNTVTWSPEMFRIFGRDPALGIPNLEGQVELYTPQSTQKLFDAVSKAVADGTPYELELMTTQPDGEQRPCFVKGFPERDNSGRVVRLAGLVQDITEQKRREDKIRLAASVFSHAREGITITDKSGAIIDVNQAFTRITGYSRDEVLGKNPSLLKSGHQDDAFYKAMWSELLSKGHWNGEVWNRRKNGELFAELLAISAVPDAQGSTQQYVALFSDITALKEHQNQLEHIAHFDALTGLPNRVLLADRLQQAMMQAQRRGQQLAVAYLDLDGFKSINDLHGHETGDHVLVTLASRMKQALRECDTLARLGGDEFVAVLSDLEDVAASLPMLTRLLSAAAQPVQVGNTSLHVSASLGVTFYPQEHDIDADQLLRQSDQAMYQAKVAGKNRYQIFDAAQDSHLRVHHESLERIRIALRNHEFVLHYQPKVNMRTGKIVGAEALIRWQHPQRGLLAPSTFLPVIEDHPLAVDVGEWVIDRALTQMEVWSTAGLDLAVSVNIGASQLQRNDFVERLKSILASHPQVNPVNLELEVLETSALADMTQVSQVIEDCAKIGVKFALDDFGTGYSSLTYLKRLRVTLLKIDQSFVRDMLDDPDDLAILQGVIGLAAAFKRDVIAEGVETIAHGTLLLQLGCELAQGYGIARPMPPEQIPMWANNWNPDAAWRDLTVPAAASRTPATGRQTSIPR